MRKLMAAAALLAALGATTAAPVAAQEDAAVPIADVIEEVKAQIRKAQAEDMADCPLRIKRIDLRFVVEKTEAYSASVGKKVEFFGVAIGAEAGAERADTARSTIDIALVPDARADAGLADVSGSAQDFATLILHTKEQIAMAAESDPPLTVETVKIETLFKVRKSGEAGVTIAIIEAGAELGRAAEHKAVLTLVPREEGGC